MRKNFYMVAALIVLAFLLLVPIGCDNLFSGDNFDWDSFMSCPGTKRDTTSDLQWVTFDCTPSVAQPLPGDKVLTTMIMVNAGDPTSANPNIPYASNLRIFLEDQAAGSGVGTIGPEDWFVAEFVVPGLFAQKQHVIVEDFTIPWTDHFPHVMPDPNNPPNLGPDTVDFTVYGLLDSQDCIGETDDTNNQTTATINGAAGPLTVYNPYLPNLQIKFIDRTPASPLPQTGGAIITEWEVLNAGIGPVTVSFTINVILSEDDVFDPWDQTIGTASVSDTIPGSSNKLIYVTAQMPYSIWRSNSYAGEYSSVDRWQGSDDMSTREPPPNGPPGYNFVVYPCIAGSSYLIGLVDANDDIRESVEIDNYSYQGTGGNGDIIADNTDAGPYDLECVELRADMLNNTLDGQIRYNFTLPWADQGSIGWYYSKNDDPQFGDYYIERFWYLLTPGQGQDVNHMWSPNNAPAPGTYRVVVCMDDIFKWQEPNEDNNWKLSTGTVTIQ